MTPDIDLSYWAFAFTQSMLMLTAGVGAALNLYWYRQTWTERPPLRDLILFVALLHAALAIESAKWVAERAIDPGFAVDVARAILETKSYWGFVAIKAVYLILAGAQTLALWRVREIGAARFVLLATLLIVMSVIGTGFHHQQLDAYCSAPPGCRVE